MQLGAEVGAVHRGDADVDGAVLGPVRGDLGGPLGRLDDDVVVAGDDVEPVPAAVDERLERAARSRSVALASLAGGRRVDALRAAVGHRAVDGDVAPRPLDRRRSGVTSVTIGPAPPVAGRERVEVGAEREPLAAARPAAPSRSRIWSGWIAAPVEVDWRIAAALSSLAAAVAADLVLVGVEPACLGVDVERERRRSRGRSAGSGAAAPGGGGGARSPVGGCRSSWSCVHSSARQRRAVGEVRPELVRRTSTAPTRWPCACRGTCRCRAGRRRAPSAPSWRARGT